MHTRIRATGLRVSLNLLYLGVLAVALPWLIYRRLTTNRYREGVRSKLFGVKPRDLPPLPQPDAAKQTGTKTAGQLEPNKTVWLHGVSVGEVQLLAALHKAWCQQDPSLRFVVSTTTDSGMALARKLFPDASLVYFPFDFTWAIRSTLNAIQPDLIVLGELELWPNLTSISQERGIPLAVINGRLSDGSFRNYRRLSRFTQPMFSRLSYVGAQTKTYAQRFAQCGTPG
ncbi:MAG: glycosyltransferase N-terminal domain-containing protein, partial [Planctomycetota bacterium]